MPTTSVSSSHLRRAAPSSWRRSPTRSACRCARRCGRRRSGCRTAGLKICTFCRAICARRSRRISSSLLPLNMLPVMTSIQPACWVRGTSMALVTRCHCGPRSLTQRPGSLAWQGQDRLRYALDWYSPVSVFTRIMSPSLMNGGTWTTSPVSSVAGFSCALAVAPLIAGHRLDHLQVDRLRQLDADRLGAVELHLDDRSRAPGSSSRRRAPRRSARSARSVSVSMKW